MLVGMFELVDERDHPDAGVAFNRMRCLKMPLFGMATRPPPVPLNRL